MLACVRTETEPTAVYIDFRGETQVVANSLVYTLGDDSTLSITINKTRFVFT